MENKNNNTNVSETINQQGTGESTTETKTDNTAKRKKTQVSADTGKAKSKNNNSKQTKGGDNSGVDITIQNEGTSGKGGNAESTVIPAPETPQTTADHTRARIAADIFKRMTHETVFFTADFIPFGDKNDAVRHAANLSDKTIIEHKKQ